MAKMLIWQPYSVAGRSSHYVQTWNHFSELGARCVHRKTCEIIAEVTQKKPLSDESGEGDGLNEEVSKQVGRGLLRQLRNKKIRQAFFAVRPGVPQLPEIWQYNHAANVLGEIAAYSRIKLRVYTQDFVLQMQDVEALTQLQKNLDQMQLDGIDIVGPPPLLAQSAE